MKYTECQCGCKVYVDPFKLGGVSARQAYIICMLCEVRAVVDDQMFHWNANIGMTILHRDVDGGLCGQADHGMIP